MNTPNRTLRTIVSVALLTAATAYGADVQTVTSKQELEKIKAQDNILMLLSDWHPLDNASKFVDPSEIIPCGEQIAKAVSKDQSIRSRLVGIIEEENCYLRHMNFPTNPEKYLLKVTLLAMSHSIFKYNDSPDGTSFTYIPSRLNPAYIRTHALKILQENQSRYSKLSKVVSLYESSQAIYEKAANEEQFWKDFIEGLKSN